MTTVRAQRGLPIAAHLGLLVTLAVSCALVVALAIVLLLPPRPPDVMRADRLVDGFVEAYQAARTNAPISDTQQFRFAIEDGPPEAKRSPARQPLQGMLAGVLSLPIDQVRASARIERRDNFVFRVEAVEHFERAIIAKEMRELAECEAIQSRVITIEKSNGGAPRVSISPLPAPPPLPPEAMGLPLEPPLPPPAPMFAPAPPGVLLLSGFELAAQLPDQRWLVMRQTRTAEFEWALRAAGAFAATLLLLALLAWFFAQRLAKPIQGFSRAVQAVGVDPHQAPVALQGPRELRKAAASINAMQARLRTLIADRTQTLATVAHDMRTPLMRMRLAAENATPDLRDRLSKDIGDVEALIASFIAFARDDPAQEARVRLDLSALLESLAEDRRAGAQDVQFEGPERLVFTGQPVGLKRLFDNLIDNGVKYGERVRIVLKSDDACVRVEVIDQGPGVAEAMREQIFKPFVRASQEHSGAGLGLASARAIARAHGGDVEVAATAPGPGAVFRVTLPL